MKLLIVLLLVGQVFSLVHDKRKLATNGVSFNSLIGNSLTYNSLTYNALTYNGLSHNGIFANGFNSNGLATNGLTLNSITLNALNAYLVNNPNTTLGAPHGIGLDGTGITDPNTNMFFGIALDNGTLVFSKEQDTADLAQFFQYLVKCTLPPTDSWKLNLNGTEYTFPGVLGLIPEIKERPITDSESRLLSACLLAHVNHFGIHVTISVRSGDLIEVSEEELDQYRVYEGAFFGDLGNSSLYSCQGEPASQALSESSSRSLRVCTDGSTCGFPSVGRCKDVCNFYLGELGYKNCTPDGITYYPEVMNVYLKSDLVESAGVISASLCIAMTTLLFWILS